MIDNLISTINGENKMNVDFLLDMNPCNNFPIKLTVDSLIDCHKII